MLLIAHRGNINGRNKEMENNPLFIEEALKCFHCEVDVWFSKGELYLGHDTPVDGKTKHFPVNEQFLLHPKLWCHAKNPEAFEALIAIGTHTFYHSKDEYTLTTKKYVWCYPTSKMIKNAICNQPEWTNPKFMHEDFSYFDGWQGICSNHVAEMKDKFDETIN